MKRAIFSTTITVALLAAFVSQAWANGEFRYPVSGTLTSTYWSPRPYGYHQAIDIAAPSWTQIGAARGGSVVFSGWSGGYGNLVIVDHGASYRTYYAHMIQRSVGYGQQVSLGQKLGYVGSTGNSTGPHVHFEIRRYNEKKYIPGSSGNWVTKGNAIPYDYPGLSSTSGGGSTPGGSSTPSLKVVKVTASALNVRTGPSTSYAIKGQIYSGQRYARIAVSGSWEKIWYDGTTGWVHGGYTETLSGVPAVKITWNPLNVRTGPSTSYAVVGQVSAGQYYAKIDTSAGWVKICFKGAYRWCYGGGTQTVYP